MTTGSGGGRDDERSPRRRRRDRQRSRPDGAPTPGLRETVDEPRSTLPPQDGMPAAGELPRLADTPPGVSREPGSLDDDPRIDPGLVDAGPLIPDRLILGEDHTQAFAELSSTHPLLLLPVRLETRFDSGNGENVLKVRVYPDQIHLHEHRPLLTRQERAWGETFWRRRHAAQSDEERAAVEEWLAERLPPRRAVWVARQTAPGVTQGGRLTFQELETRNTASEARAAALPRRWALVGYVDGVERFVEFGRPVPGDLAFSPQLDDAVAFSEEEGALPVDAGFAWMVDYDEAVSVGMAVTLTLDDELYNDIAQRGLTLLAVGVRDETTTAGRDTLESLLRSHRYTDGLELLPQGTPTNHTDAAIAGWTSKVDDVSALMARELDGAGVAEDDDSNGVRLALALGLLDREVLTALLHAETNEEASMRAMNRGLWPVTWGRYLTDLMAPESGGSVVPSDAVDTVREWFIENVRGGAALPVLAVGPQPYGVLPVRRTVDRGRGTEALETLEWLLLDLRERWRESLSQVPRLDPVVGDEIGADPEDDVVTILGSLPHPGRFVVRRLTFQRSLRLFFWDWIWLEIDDPQAPLYPLATRYRELEPTIHGIESQLEALNQLRSDVPSLFVAASRRDDAYTIVDSMIAMAEAHRDRQDPVQRLFPRYINGVFASDVEDDPKLFWSGYGSATEDRIITRPLVQADDAGPGATARDYLESLRNRVPVALGEVEAPPLELPGGPGATRPGTQPVSPLSPLRRSALNRSLATARRRDPSRPGAQTALATGPAAELQTPPVLTVPTAPGEESVGEDGLSGVFHAHEPLLYQLMDAVIDDLPPGQRAAYRKALADLRDTAAEDLTLRLRETLGLGTHRLDAWITGLARQRLHALRDDDATGIQLGGFGWVEDLKPDGAGTRQSHGFIHAPSLSHAATAAVLRAGWHAHGTDAADSTAAVNLRSDRMRTAKWILDGVRQGQALGDLLGCRFERTLHDRGLDAYIDDCRRRVLESQGKRRDPRGPADGLELAALYQGDGVTVDGGTSVTPTSDFEDSHLKGLKESLDDLLGAMDAVADGSLADAVHHLLQGNRGRASATLDAISTGAVPPPELRSLHTPRPGPGVTHRLMLTLGEEPPATAAGPRASLEPALDTWVEGMLGDLSLAVCTVAFESDLPETEAPPDPLVVTLADVATGLGMSALDVVFTAPPGDPGGDTPWRRRVEAFVLGHAEYARWEGALVVDFDAGGVPGALASGAIPLSEYALLAQALRSLLSRARSLDARDLALPGTDLEPGWDLSDAEERVLTTVDRFKDALSVLDTLLPEATEDDANPVGTAALSELRGAMLGLAGYALPGAVPRSGFVVEEGESGEARRQALYDEARLLAEAARRRLHEIEQMEVAWSSEDQQAGPAGDEVVLQRLHKKLAQVVGPEFPLLLRFDPSGVPGLVQGFSRSDELLGNDPARAMAWLQQVAKVRAEAGRLDEAATLADLITGTTSLRPAVAQFPAVPGEAWAAQAAPRDPTQGRLALFAVDHGGLAGVQAQTAIRGLLFDAWTERIPSPDLVTGVALQFDAPTSRPPQSLLLLVPPEGTDGAGEEWSFDLVVDSLLETLEAAKLRMVDPDILLAHGHQFPATFPPGTISAGPQPETS